MKLTNWAVVAIVISPVALASFALADDQEPSPAKTVLLVAQGPDGSHPEGTHEYRLGLKILQGELQSDKRVRTKLVMADQPWPDAQADIDRAASVVLYVAEGARWLQDAPRRHQALARLAQRKGGLVVIHWGMGTREAKPIDAFVRLFGACHGGPDRKYQVVTTMLTPVGTHSVLQGIKPTEVRDEFYYRLKTPPQAKITPLLTARIEERDEMVAWAWDRPDGGRSAGFSGLHFHSNWELPVYRRLMRQGVLWTLRLPIRDATPQ